MRTPAALALAVFLTPSAPAFAAPDRYEIRPAESGFLRLDRQTGAVSFCTPSAEGYACRPATDAERSAQGAPSPIERRLAAIEDRLAKLEGGKPAPSPDAAAKDPTLDLPTEEQMDRATSFLERAVKRLRDLAESLQKADEAGQDRQRL